MKKVLLGIILGVLVVAVCTTISFPSQTPNEEPSSAVPVAPQGDGFLVAPCENGQYYAALDASLQPYYDDCLANLLAYSKTDTYDAAGTPALEIALNPPLRSADDVQRICDAVYNDHPELFYLTGQYTFWKESDAFTSVVFEYCMTITPRKIAAAEIEEVIVPLIAACEGKTDFEKELYLHDALLELCEYDEDAVDLPIDSTVRAERSSAYGALCKGQALCGGYTRAMQLLLARVGIDNTPVYSEDHVWNLVFLDGEGYHLDATWNDSNKEFPVYHYFNVTTTEILASRAIDTAVFDPPLCNATDANYYIKQGLFVQEAPSDAFSACFSEQLLAGDDRIEVRFSAAAYAAAMKYIRSDAFRREFQAIYSAENADALQEDWYVFSYVTAEEIGALTFFSADS